MACAVLGGCGRKGGVANGPIEEPQQLPKQWPQGLSEPLKITEQLVIAIPQQYVRAAIYHGKARKALLTVQSDRAEAQFDFFLPGFSGYTLENFKSDADQDKVEVVYLHAGDPHEADADAPGEYPPNMLKRALRDFVNPNAYQDQFGLRCYQDRSPSGRLTCYGKRSADEDIVLYTKVPPYAAGDTFPVMQARYFSTRYGGVRIAWRSHVKNLPRWHDIDAQIWKFIDAWQVLPEQAQAPPPQAPARR
ncbi:MAG TPA: hypothetical protein VEY89_11475 [Candidatus Dormibacteraeota bacterium]|nr:hypothetical protein [Candidatus Dormibacteraeota bacterium]